MALAYRVLGAFSGSGNRIGGNVVRAIAKSLLYASGVAALLIAVPEASAQTFNGCQSTSGTLCQGAGCPTPPNTNQSITYNNMTSDDVAISITNTGPRSPCGMGLDVQQGDGVFNGTDFVPNGTASGALNNLIFPGPAKTVTYQTATTDVGNTVKIKIGPPTGTNVSNACNPQNVNETYSYSITCVPKRGTIVIKKQTTGGTGSFSYTTTKPAAQATFSVGPLDTTGANPATQTISNLAPGTYTVSEIVPAGWSLTGIGCSTGGSGSGNTATINLTAGATVTCTFNNAKKPTLTLIKSAVNGDGATAFAFSSTPSLGIPSLTPPASGSSAASTFGPVELTVGQAYSISETVPAGWTLTSKSCVVAGGGSIGTTSATGVGFTPEPGQAITCTFTNTRQTGSLKIIKTVIGGTGSDTFAFSLTNPSGGSVTLSPSSPLGNGQSATASNLPVGSPYTITEMLPAGWTMTVSGAGCTKKSDNMIEAAITADTQTVCSVTNTQQRGSITITKTAVGGDATFPFTTTGTGFTLASLTTSGGTKTQTVSDLAAGTYTIEEGATAGWSFTSLVCSPGVTVAGAKATINLPAGGSASCTYTNTKNGSIKIIKKTVNGDGTFKFTTSGTGLSAFSIATSSGSGSKEFTDLAPGSYSVTETVPDGWTLTSLACSAGGTDNKPTANITLAAGASVTCTYTNTKKLAALSLAKTADPTTYTAPGQLITYTYTVKNTGDLNVTNISVTDDKIVGAIPCSPSTLAPGASATCTAAYTITAADITAGSVTNTAKATGKDPSNTTVSSNEAKATITFDKQGHIDRTKEVIRNFLNRRVDLLASNEPDRARLLRRFNRQQPEQPGSMKDGPMKLGGSAEAGNSRFSFATSFSQMRAQAQAEAARKAERAKGGDAADDPTQDPTQTAALDEATGRDGARPGAMRLGAAPDRPHHLMPVTGGGPPPTIDVWVEGHFQRWEDDAADADRSGKFGILYIGADYLVRPWLLVGALVQFDRMDDKSAVLNTEVSGNGWMAGPYMSMKLSDNLIFDARAAWGQSDNEVDPFGVYSDEFETDRWLAKANLTGNWQFGRLRVTPSVGVIYVEERQKAYVDAVGVTISGQKASIGRLTFGPEFGYVFERPDGSVVEPHVSFTGMWDFDKDATTTINGLTVSNDDFRVKVEGGVIVRAPTGLSFRTTLSYDGLGADDFSAWGGQVWVNVPLN